LILHTNEREREGGGWEGEISRKEKRSWTCRRKEQTIHQEEAPVRFLVRSRALRTIEWEREREMWLRVEIISVEKRETEKKESRPTRLEKDSLARSVPSSPLAVQLLDPSSTDLEGHSILTEPIRGEERIK